MRRMWERTHPRLMKLMNWMNLKMGNRISLFHTAWLMTLLCVPLPVLARLARHSFYASSPSLPRFWSTWLWARIRPSRRHWGTATLIATQVMPLKDYARGMLLSRLAIEIIAHLYTSPPLGWRKNLAPLHHCCHLSPMSALHALSMRCAHRIVCRASVVSSCAPTRCWRSSPCHHPILCLLTHNFPHPPMLF